MIRGTKDGYPDLLSRGMVIRCISENHKVRTMQPNKSQADHKRNAYYITQLSTETIQDIAKQGMEP